jgi:hypothetical protein
MKKVRGNCRRIWSTQFWVSDQKLILRSPDAGSSLTDSSLETTTLEIGSLAKSLSSTGRERRWQEDRTRREDPTTRETMAGAEVERGSGEERQVVHAHFGPHIEKEDKLVHFGVV